MPEKLNIENSIFVIEAQVCLKSIKRVEFRLRLYEKNCFDFVNLQ